MPVTLSEVRSYQYLIGGNIGLASWPAAIASSAADLYILSGPEHAGVVLNRAMLDPGGSKLLIGYMDIGETSPLWTPSLFTNGVPNVTWFGKAVPGFNQLFSVQYWKPEWRPILYDYIDRMVTQGYDGAFLDVASGFQWLAGNAQGNAVFADATAEMAKLITDLRAYVSGKGLTRPFYLIANNPSDVAQASLQTLKALDAVMFEGAYYTHSQSNAVNADFIGERGATQARSLATTYASAGLKVFGLDYAPLTDRAADYRSFGLFDELGWVPGINNPSQDIRVLSSGPLYYRATTAAPSVVGGKALYNYLSGGDAVSAVLTGGDAGNTFVGGRGRNTITGGAAADDIYAHAKPLRGMLELTVFADVKDVGGAPALTVLVNGKTIASSVAVTGTAAARQTVALDLSASGAIASVEIVASGVQFVDATHYSNVQLSGLTYQGAPVALSAAAYSQAATLTGSGALAVFNDTGRATFAAPALPVVQLQTDTSDQIDGASGLDVVRYAGPASDYAVTTTADGTTILTALKSAEGPDKLINVEILRFADGDIRIGASLPPVVDTAFARVLRTGSSTPATLAGAVQIEDGLGSGALSTNQAMAQVVKLAANTSSVATLAYEFFTGGAPSAAGMDYLVSPTGPNPNNLNSAYYQSFNIENRYINFAVNLGKMGAGKDAFTAAYGSMSLLDTTRVAYKTIFGSTPSDQKLHDILDPTFQIAGKTVTRAEYFATYGGDGVTGIGTKAAMVGWLLTEAVKADVGIYARSNDAFLLDVAVNNAPFGVDLVGKYAKAEYAFG